MLSCISGTGLANLNFRDSRLQSRPNVVISYSDPGLVTSSWWLRNFQRHYDSGISDSMMTWCHISSTCKTLWKLIMGKKGRLLHFLFILKAFWSKTLRSEIKRERSAADILLSQLKALDCRKFFTTFSALKFFNHLVQSWWGSEGQWKVVEFESVHDV